MKLSLHRAASLQTDIRKRMDGLAAMSFAQVSIFEKLAHKVSLERERNVEIASRKTALIDALYSVRELVGVKNAEAGVTGLLTKQAHNAAMREHLALFAGASEVEETEVLEKRAERQSRMTESSGYGRGPDDTMRVNLFERAAIDQADQDIQALRRQATEIQAKIAMLNHTVEIELDETTICTLRAEGLI